MRGLTASLLLGLSLALGGCNGFEPKLGDIPFKCGNSEPKCPEGYVCRTSGGSSICVKPGVKRTCGSTLRPITGVRAGDGGVFDGVGYNCTEANCEAKSVDNNCLDRDLEPNDCPEAADDHSSFIGGKDDVLSGFGTWTNFSVCPIGDVDYVGFDVEMGMSYRTVVIYDKRLGDLDMSVVDPTVKSIGESLTGGRIVDMSRPQDVAEEVRFTATASGRVYLVVFGGNQAQTGTYRIYIAPTCSSSNPVCPTDTTCNTTNGACEGMGASGAPPSSSVPDAGAARDGAAGGGFERVLPHGLHGHGLMCEMP